MKEIEWFAVVACILGLLAIVGVSVFLGNGDTRWLGVGIVAGELGILSAVLSLRT